MKNRLLYGCIAGLTLCSGSRLLAADPTAPDTRYGLFNLLDHRSSYGQGVFQEPFLIDDSDLETRELRLDWLHTANGSAHSDVIHPELEWGFGLATLEIETPYERTVADGETTSGMANIDLGARCPFFQYVSPKGGFDITLGGALELGIPTTSSVSHDTEFVPKFFADTKIGHFTIETVLGDSLFFGPDGDGGKNTFEYGFSFGYGISHETLPLPGVLRLVPVFELAGETQLNKGDAGHNSLMGGVGFRVNLKPIGGIQPRPGVLFTFPVDSGARSDTHWGIMTSLVFEF